MSKGNFSSELAEITCGVSQGLIQDQRWLEYKNITHNKVSTTSTSFYSSKIKASVKQITQKVFGKMFTEVLSN